MLIKIIKPDFTFNDDRGSLVQLVHSGFKQFNIITSKAGAFRGNHYHQQNEEAFYIIHGKILLTVIQNDTEEKYNFQTGDMFQIPRNICHSFLFETDTLLASMYSNGVELTDGRKDILR
ncbi:cupin domain-containing protein [Caproicibacter fermentans]|uniref:Cupin domain-containing protein n=1 Tax=Caproicibacter fermentans TaxID=2576756 RepID=A0A7G8TFN8_9FIRM|nr:cupin domain-containing protein [Caproicibacter fermentans]QNK42429.1 cupin domain-containing protein [Caproicibacter fermentans]